MQVIVDLDSDIFSAANAAASLKGKTVEAFIAGLVDEAVKPKPTLTWKGEAALSVLMGCSARPGGKLPIQAVSTRWLLDHANAGTEALVDGLNELEHFGYIKPVNEQSTAVEITETGYDAGRGV